MWRAGVCIYGPGCGGCNSVILICAPFWVMGMFHKRTPSQTHTKVVTQQVHFFHSGLLLVKASSDPAKKGRPRRKYGQHQHSYRRESEQLLFPSSHVITKCDEPSRYHGPKKCIISSHMKRSEKKNAASALRAGLHFQLGMAADSQLGAHMRILATADQDSL